MEPDDQCDEVWQVDLRFELEPVSVQSSRKRKEAFAEVMRESLRTYQFMIVDDVQLLVHWITTEQSRYESDRKADIDNILKPLIDSLTGPQGLIVDDTLIQSLHCSWLGHVPDKDILEVRISSVKSESISEIAFERGSLVFVEVDKHLYFPIDDSLPSEFRTNILQLMDKRIHTRDEIRTLTDSYHAAQSVMPLQRLFHRSRIVRFPNFTASEYAARLEATKDES